MRKFLSLLLVAACSAFMLFAAGSKEAPVVEEGPVTLTYWQHSSAARDEMMLKVVEKFQAQNPNITVKCEFIPQADYNQKIIPSLATATAPDVFQIQSGMVGKLASYGSIQPLDEKVLSTSQIADLFTPATVDGLKYDGKYYGMPTDTQTIICFFNKEHLKEAGLDAEKGPQTWNEFFDYARKLTVRDADGKMVRSGWGGKGYYPEVCAYIEQMGGKFYDEATGKFVFADDPKAIEAFRSYSNLYNVDHVYDTKFTKNWAGFRQGLVSLMLRHPVMIGNLVTTAPNLDYGVCLIPAENGKHDTCVTSWAYVMSAKAPSAAATKFIEFLGSEEIEKMWTQATGELPARKSLLNDASLKSNPKIAVAIDSLKDSFVGRLQTGSLYNIYSQYFEKIIATDEKLEDILKEMQTALNEELSSDI